MPILKYLFLVICGYALLGTVHLFAYDTDAESKMDSIISNSDAVVLSEENVIRIMNDSEAEHRVRRRILIKNEAGERYCRVRINTSQFVLVDDIEGTLYDLQNEIIKELDEDDIEENALSPRDVLYMDQTSKYFSLTHISYPYIIEYSYVRELKSLFFLPDWYPQMDIPVLVSDYKLILEENIKVNTYMKGMNIKPEITLEDENKVYTWNAKNIEPRLLEDNMAPEDHYQKFMLLAPSEFVLGDYHGSFSSWESMAKWYFDLAAGRYELPENAVLEIKEMIKNVEDEKQIIKLLYTHLQEKTRYVAIYLDVGGWQPHSASTVYKNRYGDCKDLSTLMVSMLDVAGIKAYPALALTRGMGTVYDEFPSNQFNHCIAVVPMKEDTIYLECTADFVDLDDMPYNIEGIKVLLIKKEGGKLIRTPQSGPNQNMWTSILDGSLENNGDLQFSSRIRTTGNQKNFYKLRFGFQKAKDVLLFLQKLYGRYFSSPDITDYAYKELDVGERPLELTTKGKFKKFGSIIGNRILFDPNILNQILDRNIPDEKKRSFDIYMNYPYLDVDTVSIKLPAGYVLEAAPEACELTEPFAAYNSSYDFKDGILVYTRRIEYTKNRIDVGQYDQYRNFIKRVSKSDQAKFIFKK